MNLLRPIATLALAFGATGWGQPPVKTVDHVDLQRYLGRWYEIARIPNSFEKKCVRDVTAEYARNGSDITVRNACVKADGSTYVARGRAKVADKATGAKLRVTFFWPFYGDYWIIGLDPEYRWAIIGEPGRKYGWVLSRTPSLPPATLDAIRQRFEASGYRPADLVYPQQTTAR